MIPIGKIVILSFSNSEEHILHEIMQIIRMQPEFQIRDMVLNDEILDSGKLIINPLKRNAEKNGQEIKLTLYEFEILYLLAKIPAGYFQKHKFMGRYGKSHIIRHMTVSCISFIICVVKLKMTGNDRSIF